MENMILVLDESGAKGYAKNDEKYDGEVGVMAGYVYTEEEILDIERLFRQFTAPISEGINGKLHIADLDESAQEVLRKNIFCAFKTTSLQWFYTAIYSKGFHQSEFMEGRGGQQDERKSLHVELFKKTLMKSLCLVHSLGKHNVKLVVKTDNIDSGTLKKFKIAAQFVSHIFLQNEREIFKYVKKGDGYEKEKALLSVKCDSVPRFDALKIEIECDSSPLTVAADILANSVNYYLREKQKVGLGMSLNNKMAIEAHPLVDLALTAEDEVEFPSLLDIVNRRE